MAGAVAAAAAVLDGPDADRARRGLAAAGAIVGLDALLAGRRLEVSFGGRGYELDLDGERCRLRCADLSSFFRAVGRLAGLRGPDGRALPGRVAEERGFARLGAMVDASRNAVPRIATLKDFLARIALMGYTTLYLYMEDTYEVPGEPYFGHLRGRYSFAELKELDDAAWDLGIEVVPCIQTLAHVCRYLAWPHTAPLRDNADILLASDPAVLDLLRSMLTAATAPFRSERVHVGMDEAFEVGLGRYLALHGYRDRFEVLTAHLDAVVGICRDLGRTAIMWSDMFFRLSDPSADYAADSVPEAAVRAIPDGVQLVYWDYFSTDKAFYENKLRRHEAMKPGTIFAGSVWTYNGLSVAWGRTLGTTLPAVAACRSEGVGEAMATLWGDDGAETHFMHALLGLQLFAELAFGLPIPDPADPRSIDMDLVGQRFRACCGGDPRAFLALDRINNLRSLMPDPRGWNLGKLAFYQDVLQGRFDRHLEALGMDLGAWYGKLAADLEAYAAADNGLAYLFGYTAAYCRVLELKATLGLDAKAAYDCGDKAAAAGLAGRAREARDRVGAFRRAWKDLWTRDFKAFGGEVLDIRCGALAARLEAASEALEDWSAGRADRVEELEAPRLFHDGRAEAGDDPQVRVNRWHHIVTAGYIAHNVP